MQEFILLDQYAQELILPILGLLALTISVEDQQLIAFFLLVMKDKAPLVDPGNFCPLFQLEMDLVGAGIDIRKQGLGLCLEQTQCVHTLVVDEDVREEGYIKLAWLYLG